MTGYLDSTIYIIDTENDFYICTKDKNLKLVLKDVHKERIYFLIERLKMDRDYLPEDPFEKKILQLLTDHGLYTYESKKQSIDLKDVSTIFGPNHLLKIISREIHNSSYLEQNHQLKIESNEKDYPVYLSIARDKMYISSTPIPDHQHSHSTLSEEFLTYAAYVFLEQLQKRSFQITELNKYVVVIDLSIYENPISKLAIDCISHKNFKASMLFDPIVNGGSTNFDYHSYFPFVTMQYKNREINTELSTFGFNEEDAINNLLHLLANHFNQREKIELIDMEKMSLSKVATLITKLMSIKLNKKVLVKELDTYIEMVMDDINYYVKVQSTYNEISYLITLYLNGIHLDEVQEAMVK